MKCKLIIAFWTIFLLIPKSSNVVYAASVSTASGLWDVSTTWVGGSVPSSTDTVHIVSPHIVTFNLDSSTTTCMDVTIESGGTLQFAGGTNTMQVNGYIIVNGTLSMQASSTLKMECAAAVEHGVIVNSGGTFNGTGTAVSIIMSTSTTAISTSDTVFNTAVVTGWFVGDKIAVGRAGSGSNTEYRTIQNISGTQITVSVSFSNPHNAGCEVVKTNRDCKITAADTDYNGYILVNNGGTLNLDYIEVTEMGDDVATDKYGITIKTTAQQSPLNKCSVHSGYMPIYLYGADNCTLSNNVVCKNSANGGMEAGIRLTNGSDNNLVINNIVFDNGRDGINLRDNSINNRLINNICFDNIDDGISCTSGSYNNIMEGNTCYHNGDDGFEIGAPYLIVHNNEIYSNLNNGISLWGCTNNLITSNTVYLNDKGIVLGSGSQNNTLISNNVYSNNDYGLSCSDSINNLAVNCDLGLSGNNSDGDVGFVPGNLSTLIMRNCTLASPIEVDITSIDTEGSCIISQKHDGTDGLEKLWGQYNIAGGENRQYNYDYQLYVSSATIPKTRQGSSSLSLIITSDTNTLSEYWKVEYSTTTSNWTVTGSVRGEQTNHATGGVAYNSDNGEIAFTLAEVLPVNGDVIDFVTMAASGDVNTQKKIEIGPCANSLNDGKSKLTVEVGGCLEFVGNSSNYTLVEGINGTTYYSLISSGTFTAEYFKIQNLDNNGIQFIGSGIISLNFGMFDYVQSASSATYITCNNLTSDTIFYYITFDDTEGVNPYNASVIGDDSNLNWVFNMGEGSKWGEDYDNDFNNKIIWDTDPGGGGVVPREPCGIKSRLSEDGKCLRIEWSRVEKNEDGRGCNDLAGYNIYRCKQTNGTWIKQNTSLLKEEFWEELEDISGILYYYMVRAVDAYNNESIDSMIVDSLEKVIAVGENRKSKVVIPREISDILYKDSNSYGDDLKIEVNWQQEAETGGVISAYNFIPVKADNREAVERFYLDESEAEIVLTYTVENGMVKGSSGVSADQAEEQLSLFRFNGLEWTKIGGNVDEEKCSISINSKWLGQYQIQQSVRKEFDLVVRPRIFTPNGDRRNDICYIHFDNPQERRDLFCKIYDIRGALVRHLPVVYTYGVGYFYWDGKDNSGRGSRSGIYIYQLEAAGKVINGTVVIAR